MTDDVRGTMTVHQRMVAILGELPAIGKSQRNEQQKFMYRGHDDVLNALNPLLTYWGVFVVPDVLERVTDQRSTKSGSVMFEVNLHVRYRFYGVQGDYVEASAWGEGTDMGDKATNKAMTMAFKAVLAQAFAISTAENADSDAGTPEETVRRDSRARDDEPEEAAAKGGARGWDHLWELLGECGVPREDAEVWVRQAAKEAHGLESLKDASPDERRLVFRQANDALADLSTRGDLAFSPDARAEIREAFAAAFGGAVLEGPPWRLGPNEPDRPTKVDWDSAQAG